MISSSGGLRVYVATRPTDFRKGIDHAAGRLVAHVILKDLSCFV
ncbi:hypothetical protein [Roseivivax marinus]|nr:hypothetical protein [Roseivivax marinus]